MPINVIDFSEDVVVGGVLYRLFKDLFEYSWEATVLANTSSSPVTVSIQADSDFIAVKGVASMYQNVAGRTHIEYQDMTVLVTDSGSGRNLMDKAAAIRHICGHPQEPVIYQPPKPFVANSVVSVTFTNNSNQDTIVRATMIGYKLYRENRGAAIPQGAVNVQRR